MASIYDLIGKTLHSVSVDNSNDEIQFHTTEGEIYLLYHRQDCCESVSIEGIVGDLQDLVSSPLLMAEESMSTEDPSDAHKERSAGNTCTWTFYRLTTVKGHVTICWYVESNGYYSERVNFTQIIPV